MPKEASIYRLRGPELWGDYGRLLCAGMTMGQDGDTEDSPPKLLRTGPFLPPISFPHRYVLVTDEFRSQLEQSGHFDLTFRPVEKFRIRRLDWHLWDRSQPEPARYPRGGEPEGYILSGWHSRRAAREMGRVWELCAPRVARVERDRPRTPCAPFELRARLDSTRDHLLFASSSGSMLFANAEARSWLETQVGEWIRFHACLPWQTPPEEEPPHSREDTA